MKKKYNQKNKFPEITENAEHECDTNPDRDLNAFINIRNAKI